MSDKPTNPWDPAPKDEPNPWDIGTAGDPRPWEELAKTLPDIPETTLTALTNDLGAFLADQIPSFLEDPQGPEKAIPGAKAFVGDKIKSLVSDLNVAKQWEAYFSERLPDLCSSIALNQSVAELTDVVVRLGLPYKVTKLDVYDFALFICSYAQTASVEHPEWVSGIQLMDRWGISPDECLKNLWVNTLPTFLWSLEDCNFRLVSPLIPRHYDILDYQKNPSDYFRWKSEPPNMWFCVPQWHYFRKVDVEFCEMLDPEIFKRLKGQHSRQWLRFNDVVERWGVPEAIVERAVREKGLPAYRLGMGRGILRADDSFFTAPGNLLPPGKKQCLFKLEDIRAFERNNKGFLKINERSLDRIQAQELVTEWVRENPTLRTRDVVEMLRGTGHFDHLGRDETLAEYVRHLINNHTPGPRKKS